MNTIRKVLLIGRQQSMEDDFGHFGNDQLLLDGVNHQMIDEDPNQEILDEELHQPTKSPINILLIHYHWSL